MSFWAGTENVTETYESAGGDLTPIPANTGCISAIEEAGWKEYGEDRYINLEWRVLRPDTYTKRVVYQKLYVLGQVSAKDPDAKAEKAKAMLAAIDANCGGKLRSLGREPTDADLMTHLVGKMMATKMQVWKIKSAQTGEDMTGNWISAVAPAKGAKPAVAPAPPPAPAASPTFDDDSDIPF